MPEEAEEPRTLNPFKIMRPGEDTVDGDENLVFSDFRANVLPADAPEYVDYTPAPKEESAPEPAPSSESTQTTGPRTSETTAQPPVVEDDGQRSLFESLNLASSSVPSPGPVEPPASAKPPTSAKTPKLVTPGSQDEVTS